MKIIKEQLKEMIKEELESLFNDEDYDDNEEELQKPLNSQDIESIKKQSMEKYVESIMAYSRMSEEILNDVLYELDIGDQGKETSAYREANKKLDNLALYIQREGYKVIEEFIDIVKESKI